MMDHDGPSGPSGLVPIAALVVQWVREVVSILPKVEHPW